MSDVAPYAIVGGVPARETGNGSTMSRLLICWLRDGGNVRSTNFGKEADSFSDIGLFMKNGL